MLVGGCFGGSGDRRRCGSLLEIGNLGIGSYGSLLETGSLGILGSMGVSSHLVVTSQGGRLGQNLVW